jgi:hypothetical protein
MTIIKNDNHRNDAFAARLKAAARYKPLGGKNAELRSAGGPKSAVPTCFVAAENSVFGRIGALFTEY